MKYKVLEHTADIMIKAYGKDLNELFENAAIGMCEQVVEKKVYDKKKLHSPVLKIDIDYDGDLENMLRNFLNEVRYWLYEGGRYPVKFTWTGSLVLIDCKPLNRDKTVFSDEIKSVTFHEMYITREYVVKIPERAHLGPKSLWTTKVVFDV